jgi:hypothetical protein
MSDEIFIDQIIDIAVTSGVVRMDMGAFSPTERGADGKAVMRFKQRVVMPIDGFLKSEGMIQRLIDVLVENGVVTRNAPPKAQ